MLSPDDETYEKFPFYFEHGVSEIFIVDPRGASAQIWLRDRDGFSLAGGSRLLGASTADLAAAAFGPGRHPDQDQSVTVTNPR